jgi:hypothetical protein
MRQRRIVLNIERLSIDGARPSQAALSAALNTEFERLLADPAVVRSLAGAASADRLDGGRIASPTPHNGAVGAGSLGTAIARATIGALKP